MDPVKTFQESAATFGVALTILIAICLGLLFIIWKLGSRVTASHEKYLDATAGKLQADVTAIKDAIPQICQAHCRRDDCESYVTWMKQKHA